MPLPADRSGETLRAFAERKLMQAIFDRQLQFLELNHARHVGQALRLFQLQLFVDPLMLGQEAKDTICHESHSIEH